MSFPDDKETFERVVGKNLAEGVKGDKIPATGWNAIRDFIERLEDLLGLDFNGIFVSHKLRHDDIDEKISTVGDFKADGTIPMTGDLDLGQNAVKNTEGIEIKSSNEVVELIVDSTNNNAPIEFATGRIYLLASAYNIKGIIEATKVYGDFRIKTIGSTDIVIAPNEDQHIVCSPADQKITLYKKTVYAPNSDFEIFTAGRGLLVTTPDGNHTYRISVDNSGNVISTLIS